MEVRVWERRFRGFGFARGWARMSCGGGEGCESGWVTVSRQPVRSGRGFLWGCRLVVGKGIGDA